MYRAIFLSLLFASASAFKSALPFNTRPAVASATPTARFIVLSEEETNALLNTAETCVEGECTADDVKALIRELKETEQIMQTRLAKIVKIAHDLERLNNKENRELNEIEKIIRDAVNVFSISHPKYKPAGYPGEVGDGPTTAYDALPPKPWKPASK